MNEIVSLVPIHDSLDGATFWALEVDDRQNDAIDLTARIAESRRITKSAKVPKPRVAELAEWQKKKVVRYIDDNIELSLRVQELGELINLSVSRFSKGFKASFGKSPHTYILHRRIEAAKYLIASTDQTLCQIAQSCGMSDQSHLSKLFRQHVGTTPLAWRKRPASVRSRQHEEGVYASVV